MRHEGRLPREPRRPSPLRSSLRRMETVPRPTPGPRQERPDAGRSPGSRVMTRSAAFPGNASTMRIPSGRRRIAPDRNALLVRRLQLQGQLRNRVDNQTTLTAFPF